MKLLVTIGLALVCFQALEAKDFSKVKPRLPPAFDPNYVPVKRPMPPMRTGTVDMRAVCGQTNPPTSSKIVGGFEAGVHEFPWQVALWMDNSYFCGGSLISDQWVLTAAHCADGIRNFDVWLGAHNVRDNNEQRLEIAVTARGNTHIHPEWNQNTLTGDVALIKLPNPITFTDNIRPICLPEANEADLHVGEVEIVSGWGRTSDASSGISATLQKTNVTVITNQECNAIYGIVDADTICVSTTDGHGSCNGDSGGPLSHVEADGTFTQIGVVSYGASAGCQAGYPAAFRRVSNYRNWITSVTGLV